MAIPVFVLLGRAGAGKTVVGDYYSKASGMPIIHVGQEIRSMAEQGDQLALRVSSLMKENKLYDPADVTTILEGIIKRDSAKFAHGFVLDGFPRWAGALPAFEEFLKRNNVEVGRLIYFQVPKRQSIRRQMLRGRDSPKLILEREKDFEKNELEVVQHYERKGVAKIVPAKNFRSLNKRKLEAAVPIRAQALSRIIGSVLRKRRK
ncbi:Adenylate kinase [uncultured archaeon]|nr:Adenylate kinase [uncultured archaeon]